MLLTVGSHHHRHPKADDDAPTALLGRRVSSTPFTTLKFNNTLSNGLTTPGSLPRHHHHAPHHHHHPPAQITPVAMPPMRWPITTIKTGPLLDSIAHLPRRHLGSQLYAPRVTLPHASTTSFSKFKFASKPKPLPLFEEKENCTYTIRVPRELLTERSREHVCAERQIWGTDVYTDDSDVLAAAIHSGWIRGAWGDDVDVSMLELSVPSPAGETANGEAESLPKEGEKAEGDSALREPPPEGPVSPPANRDAYITILILPPLERYSPCTWHGMRSRSWGDNHDGMSFKIHRIEWVAQGSQSRWSDKGAKALSKRLADNRRSASRCGVPRRIKPTRSGVAGVVMA